MSHMTGDSSFEYTGDNGKRYVLKDLTDERIDAALAKTPRNELDSRVQKYLRRLRDLPEQVRAKSYLDKQEGMLAQLRKDQIELADAEAKIFVLNDMKAWALNQNYRLEKNDCSRLHKFKEAAKAGRVYDDSTGEWHKEAGRLTEVQSTFVVAHDWAAAFEGAEGYEENKEFNLPYDHCSFELRINGKSIIAVAMTDPEETVWRKCFTVFLECGQYWYCYSANKDADAFLGYIWSQIKAISVALDAEVATHEVVRASSALNAKRAKAGKIPLSDYHVVDLSRRHRVANPLGGESGVRHRMHFVRGHWRHYETSKTWIKWHLRGDPDLGFIQKHYSL